MRTKLKYIHYYILDFSDIRNPRIMGTGFPHKYWAKEVAQGYFKPGTYKIRMGYQIESMESYKRGRFEIWREMSYNLLPNNVLDRKHRRRTRKQRQTIEKRKNNIKLKERRWLLRCVEQDLPGFLSLLQDYFTKDIQELRIVPGYQGLLENLQGKSGPEDWNIINFVDYIITLNILRVLVMFDYDNGPFYRYMIAYNLWKTFDKEIMDRLEGEELI